MKKKQKKKEKFERDLYSSNEKKRKDQLGEKFQSFKQSNIQMLKYSSVQIVNSAFPKISKLIFIFLFLFLFFFQFFFQF